MASHRFQAKFQDRVSHVGRLGDLDCSRSKPVSQERYVNMRFQHVAAELVKGGESLVTRSMERDTCPVFAKPISVKRPQRYSGDSIDTSQSTQPKPQTEPSRLHLSRSHDFSQGRYTPLRSTTRDNRKSLHTGSGFTPYSLDDYRKIRLRKWVMLGGLGPASQDSEAWKRSHFIHKRRLEYAQEVKKYPLL